MNRDYIYTDDLSVGYGKETLIRRISLHVRPGQIVTLIGPNGAGKSTILKTIIRQMEPLKGAVYLDGSDMVQMGPKAVSKMLSAMMTGQVRTELMTCEEVAAAGRYPYTGRLGILTKEDWKKVDEALDMVQGRELAKKDFNQISDGQKQRILLARAICQEPKAIVLDEPTSFLDIRHKIELLTSLKRLVREKNIAVLMSLHELDLAQKISDYIVCVGQNAIKGCGTPEEIFTSSYIKDLYGLTKGTYCAQLGFLEMEKIQGKPKVFVIGGNGSGIPIYRKLQREGIPFAAGVIHENDIDYPVANALAVKVISERAFEPVGERAYEEAAAVLKECSQVICCLKEFGTMNGRNRELARLGENCRFL